MLKKKDFPTELYWQYDIICFSFYLCIYNMYKLSECELFDTENISLSSKNIKFVGDL
jgi:hypothetical protein